MHPLFEIAEIPPVPPGQGPFHVKGVFYDRIVKTAAALPGGMPALLGEIRDDSVRAFAKQTFRWSDWYDAFPAVPIQVALCRVQSGEFESLVRQRGRAAAETLVPRIFRTVLSLGSPRAAAEHLPRLLGHYYDFVDLGVQVEDTEGVSTLRNAPRLLAPGFVNAVMGIIEGALHLMGAQHVVGRYSDVTLGTPIQGFETVNCKIHFRWVK